MAHKTSISGAKSNQHKNTFVSIFFTESTASFFDARIPYLEDLHLDESHLCMINSNETDYKKNNDSSSSPDILDQNSDSQSLIFDVAYFHYGSMSSISIPDTKSSNCSKIFPLKTSCNKLPYILKPKKIYGRPLVTVRSLAHNEKLYMHMDHMCLSLIESNISALPKNNVTCRICFGGESVNNLLMPCRCRGSVALVHLECLERWLLESSRSYCELCNHHYNIIREPKCNIIKSLLFFVVTPTSRIWEFLIDFFALIVYTPTAVVSTYSLMILCENIVKYEKNFAFLPHITIFLAVVGIVTIDITYSSWLLNTFEKYHDAWTEFRKNNCNLKLILPNIKKKPHKVK